MAKKRKILKILGTILLTLVILIVVLIVGIYCIFNFYIKPKYSEQINQMIEFILEDEELMAEINEVVEDEQVQAEINEAVNDEKIQAEINKVANDEQVQAEINEAVNDETVQAEINEAVAGGQIDLGAITPTAAPQTTPTATAAPTTPAPVATPKPTATPRPSDKPFMEYAQENVSPADFAEGLRIAGKTDMGYLLGLVQDGFTQADKNAAKAHLKSNLTQQEIKQLKIFIAKYAYLLK